MIDYVEGDLLKANTEALVNSVNSVGVMGRGVALEFKRRFPENFKAYKEACDWGEVQPGRMFVFETGELIPSYIINFPTKRHWRGNSRIDDIEAGLVALVTEVEQREIRSIALPPLGCGLGGLDWQQVKQLIHTAFAALPDVQTAVFEPGGYSPPIPDSPEKRPAMTPGRAALIGLMHRYLTGLGEPVVTLLEVHKLMYFMQVAGEPLRLRYVKARYGPYADNLRHVLRELEGHYIHGSGTGGDRVHQALHLRPGAITAAEEFLKGHLGTRNRFDRVAELVKGFDSAFGLELLATVHWVIGETGSAEDDDVIRATYAWNSRKRQFAHSQIAFARETLQDRGWLQGSEGTGPAVDE